MTEAQRHQILLDLLAQTGFVTVEQVISRLGISPATARRDINKLDESGKLKKVRNGAEAISEQRPRWSPMNIHQAQNHDEKVRIARAASQLVNPGESIVINCGSTAFLKPRVLRCWSTVPSRPLILTARWCCSAVQKHCRSAVGPGAAQHCSCAAVKKHYRRTPRHLHRAMVKAANPQ